LHSPVERSFRDVHAQRVTRRTFLMLAGGTSSLVLLAACQQAPSAPQPPAAPAPTLAPRIVATSSAPGPAAPTVAAVKAEPTQAAQAPPAAGQSAPKGRFAYAFHTAIPPAWLDPQENPPQVTPYNFAYTLHDALVKPMPGKDFVPSLAESYDVAPDFKSATFKLRSGIKFHDGTPVTPEDVKFTYEQYRGASAGVLKAKLERIDIPDERTIRFFFKEPFVDFLTIYGSPASGAAWIVPKAYYEKVGKDGFKTAPIGAGPYRFVRQQAGNEMEFEAFPEYWRKSPSVKTIVAKGVPEAATRLAMIQTGEIDAMYQIPGDLLDAVRRDSKLRLVPALGGSNWLEMMAEGPNSPFEDIRVRQAISLAIDRKAINDAEIGGLSPVEGNWISAEWPGALERPVPPTDVAKAKQLMAEAGFAQGFEVASITPLPPNTSWAERVASQLLAINIRTRVNTMERGAFYDKLAPGPDRLKGFIIQFSGAPGDAASRIRENAVCKGAFSGLCIPEIDQKMARYDASTDLRERKQLLDEVQAYLLDQYLMVPLVRNVFTIAAGPRIDAPKLEEIIGAIPQYIWIGPWEDLKIKD
jgi:peptide/nickel transport system substrate-binding protein